MGFRFRKSISLGKHLKLNLSKSGISMSTGIKGAHVNLNSKGVIRKTVGLGGLYYQDQHKIGVNTRKVANGYATEVIEKPKKVYTPSNSKKVRLIPAFIISIIISGFTGGLGLLIFVGCLIYNNGCNKGKW